MRIAVSPITGKENCFQCESFQSFNGPALVILQVAIFFGQLLTFYVFFVCLFLCLFVYLLFLFCESFQFFDGPALAILTVVNPVQFSLCSFYHS